MLKTVETSLYTTAVLQFVMIIIHYIFLLQVIHSQLIRVKRANSIFDSVMNICLINFYIKYCLCYPRLLVLIQ